MQSTGAVSYLSPRVHIAQADVVGGLGAWGFVGNVHPLPRLLHVLEGGSRPQALELPSIHPYLCDVSRASLCGQKAEADLRKGEWGEVARN